MDEQDLGKDENQIQPEKLSFSRKWMPSLYPIKPPKCLWKIDEDDVKTWVMQITVIIFVWIFSMISGSFIAYLCYWDGPNYVYAARTFYDIPEGYQWQRRFKYEPYYFACHLPGFPLVIKFFSTILFGEYIFGDIAAIIFCALLVTYVFRRFLIVYNAVDDPVYTTRLSVFLPLRFMLYKCVGASEPLYMSYCFLAFIFFKTDQLIFMLPAMWGACITRIEGLALVGSIGLSYLLRFDIPRAAFTALGFLGTASNALLHKIKFGDYFAYFKFNQGQQRLINPNVFYSLYYGARSLTRLTLPYNLILLESILIPGVFVLLSIAVPLGIFGVVYVIYVSVLFHIDLIRYALPAYMPALLIAYDAIWSHSYFKKNSYILYPFFGFIVALYSLGQIGTNRCEDNFFLEACDPVRWPHK
jgi:hypothetical protein